MKRRTSGRGPGGDQDLVRVHLYFVSIVIVLRNGFSQLQYAHAVGVMRLSIPDGADRCFLDAFRRVKVRLAHLEVYDISAFPLHGSRLSMTSITMKGGISLDRFVTISFSRCLLLASHESLMNGFSYLSTHLIGESQEPRFAQEQR